MHEIQSLRGLHHTICRLHVQGLSNAQIARELGITTVMVSYTINSPLGQQKIGTLQDRIDEEVKDVSIMLQESALKSQSFLQEIASGTLPANVSLRARVAMDQLDRAGHSKIQKSLNVDLHGSLTDDDLAEIKRRAFSSKNCINVSPDVAQLATAAL